MQKSMNPRSDTGKSRLIYLEYLRAFSTIAVVFLHVAVTLNANYTPNELGIGNYTFFSVCHMLVTWAVPCFVMISGSLLLNPDRFVDFSKIAKYIFRMLTVLLTFGVAYALMELVFNERTISISILGRALLNTMSGKSWSHLWYIYMLISLYLITIPLRCFIEKVDKQTLFRVILVLIAGNFIIPSINALFGIELENFMIMNEYVVYYLLGYYFSILDTEIRGTGIAALLATGIAIALETLSMTNNGAEFPLNHSAGGILVFIQSCSVFLFVKQFAKRETRFPAWINWICSASFGIYLIHPFFINLLYKVLGVTPLSLPNPLVGVIVLTVIVSVLSLIFTCVIKKLPLFRKIV